MAWSHGMAPLSSFQARILEWVGIPFSRGSSGPRDQTQISCIAGSFFTSKEALAAKGLNK